MLRAKYSEYSHRLEQCDEAWRRLSHPDNAGLCWAEALAHSGRRPSPERRSFAGGTMNNRLVVFRLLVRASEQVGQVHRLCRGVGRSVQAELQFECSCPRPTSAAIQLSGLLVRCSEHTSCCRPGALSRL